MGACESESNKNISNLNNSGNPNVPNVGINKIDKLRIKELRKKDGTSMFSFKSILKTIKSICKINYIIDNQPIQGTGFFMLKNSNEKYLLTNYHVIPETLKNKNIMITIETYNEEKMLINLNERHVKYFKEPIDITRIEIKDSDDIINEIDFLQYDLNYVNGYEQYKDLDVFTLQYPRDDVDIATGKITGIINNFELTHNIHTISGSSGSPIILINTLKVIGIHKEGGIKSNYGSFIGEIFKKNNNLHSSKSNNILKKKKDNTNKIKNNQNESNILPSKRKNGNNYIIGEILISKNSDRERRIICSDKSNKKEIEECIIEVNDKQIPFDYFHIFEGFGKYKIKYIFKKDLTNMSHMFSECFALTHLNFNLNTQNVTNMSHLFYNCKGLTDLNLSNFDTQNVTNMSDIFCGCTSLKKIDLSNINTQNVTNMSYMFCRCNSLKNLDLSSFDTQKVTNMSYMFYLCSSFKSLDLSYFNTQNVKYMTYMFYKCSSLKTLDLSNFNTQKVTNMSDMFSHCDSLTSLNLSNFNTQNVTNMNYMFFNCSCLKNLNLSSFNTQNVTTMSYMFYYCDSLAYLNILNFNTENVNDMNKIFFECKALKREKVITKDSRILKRLEELDDSGCMIY